jgi:hypothetical protein
MKLLCAITLAALSCAGTTASAGEVYGGIGSTGLELGLSHSLSERFGARLEGNSLSVTRNFTTSNVQYDARVKFSNAGLYLDWFVASSFRITGGALLGSRKIHGTARSIGNTIQLNGVLYPVVAGDSLDFDAKFPSATPYFGVGWGHQSGAPGLHLYGDVGVAIGKPEVTLTPSASLASKLNPNDLTAEQSAAQDKANSLRNYPVFKIGLRYTY